MNGGGKNNFFFFSPPGAVNCTGVFLPAPCDSSSPISERVTEDVTDGWTDNDKHMPVRSNHSLCKVTPKECRRELLLDVLTLLILLDQSEMDSAVGAQFLKQYNSHT